MSFLDEAAAQVPQRGGVCSTHLWIESQEDVTLADVDESVATNGIVATFRAMQARGYSHGRESLRRHARRECKCPS